MEMKWVRTKDQLPVAALGFDEGDGEGRPFLSPDVVALWPDVCADIANYDHDEKRWSLLNRSFEEPDCEPEYWCYLPDLPTRES
jgi:hypothetical protein